MWGCVKAPLGSSLVPKAFLWGHFWMGEWGLKRIFWSPIFQSSARRARAIFTVAVKERILRVQLHVGLHKGSLGSSVVPKAFLSGHFWMGVGGLQRVIWGPIFQSSLMPARYMFWVARDE